MPRSSIEFLRHIFDEITYLMKASQGLDKTKFLENETLIRAFVRSIEIIGEASKKVSPEIKKKYPLVEWKSIAGMRDRLIHDYFGVDYDIVWDVIQNKIPLLYNQIQDILNQENR
jgi:uncharacterized protein with HEPN domain